MGANLCSFRQPNSEQQPKSSSSIIDLITPACLKKEQKRKQKQKQKQLHPPENSIVGMERSLTLEECILASPSLNPQCIITACELHVFQQSSRKVHPSSQKVHKSYFTPRNSFSSEILRKIDEGDEKDLSSVSSMSRSQSGKLKKRVSFKLPEEADIILFYSPKEAFEE